MSWCFPPSLLDNAYSPKVEIWEVVLQKIAFRILRNQIWISMHFKQVLYSRLQRERCCVEYPRNPHHNHPHLDRTFDLGPWGLGSAGGGYGESRIRLSAMRGLFNDRPRDILTSRLVGVLEVVGAMGPWGKGQVRSGGLVFFPPTPAFLFFPTHQPTSDAGGWGSRWWWTFRSSSCGTKRLVPDRSFPYM